MASRRQLLRALAATTAVGVAGCFVDSADSPAESADSPGDATAAPGDATAAPGDATATGTGTPETLAERGIPANICEQDQQPPGEQNIAAVIDPAFASDWADHTIPDQYTPGRDDGRLGPDAVVVGMTDGERARAYPLAVLWWHEIVNDTFGEPALVTYCPLCRSGLVATRRVNGQSTTFTVTELLWTPPSGATNASVADGTAFGAAFNETDADVRTDRGNLVMIDAASGSYWSQLLARAICGPRRGDRLPLRPSRTVRWEHWQAEHPTTDVLLPPPHSGVSNV